MATILMTSERVCPRCGMALSKDSLEGLCCRCLGRVAFASSPDDAPASGGPQLSAFRRLGDYELMEEIARGGMGIVYKARQCSLNRLVALKVLLYGPFSSPQFVQRFRTEAAAVAALRHPNIVTIYDVGEQDGHHYFSMEYIEGQSLADLETPLPGRRAAGYLKTVAEAIDYAHQQGILHRDLKPSNLLLDRADQPHITDFGLAKMLDSNLELTATGQVLGSPSHMPPEQAAGKFAEATSRSDIYSLGAILYHLLTGRPPFQGETLAEILPQVIEDQPVAPRRLNASVAPDLQTICLKCLQKEPSKRYSSARELSQDLESFLACRPIRARPISAPEKFRLWCRRRPVLAGLSGALVAAVALAGAALLWGWRQAERHAQGESQARQLAEAYARQTRLNLYAADVSLAFRAMEDGDYGLARQTLSALRPKPGEEDLRGFEWRYLWNSCRGQQLATLTGHKWIVTCATFAPDGTRLATGSQDGTVKVWGVPTGELVTTLPVANHSVWSVGFASNGALLMSADGDGKVKFWNTTNWQPVSELPGKFASLSKTGSVVAVTESSPFYWEDAGPVSLWDYDRHQKLREFDKPGRALALSPDGGQLAAAGVHSGIDLWDTATGHLVRSLPTDEPVWALAFSPDGNHLVSAGWSKDVLVWEPRRESSPTKLAGHRLSVWGAAYSPDGSKLATTGSDQSIRLWDALTLEPAGELHGHDSEVWCAAFSPAGQLLASGGKDQNVMLWSTQPKAVSPSLPNQNGHRPVFSSTGSLIATALPSGAPAHPAIWDLAKRALVAELSEDEQAVAFASDGRIITWEVGARDLVLHSLEDGSAVHVTLEGLGPATESIEARGCSPEGSVFFVLDGSGQIRVWKVDGGRLQASFKGPAPPIRAARLGPDGKYFALSLERENAVRLYEVASGHQTLLAGHRDFVSGLAFSPDDQVLATGSMDGTIRLWETATGKSLAVLPGHVEEATDVAFSPDGRTLASVSHRDSIKLWHLPTRRELFSLNLPQAGSFLQFSSDGCHLAATTEEDSVRLFDAPPE